jgi:hypothetical protein
MKEKKLTLGVPYRIRLDKDVYDVFIPVMMSGTESDTNYYGYLYYNRTRQWISNTSLIEELDENQCISFFYDTSNQTLQKPKRTTNGLEIEYLKQNN